MIFRPLGPALFTAARPYGDLQHLSFPLLFRVEIPDEAAIHLELAEIVIGRHVAAAIPAFVTNAEIADLIRNLMHVRTPPQLGLSVTIRCGPMPLRQWYSSA